MSIFNFLSLSTSQGSRQPGLSFRPHLLALFPR